MSCVVSEKHIPRNMLIQKLQADLDLGGYVDTILMDLSKAYVFITWFIDFKLRGIWRHIKVKAY